VFGFQATMSMSEIDREEFAGTDCAELVTDAHANGKPNGAGA
jgi:hypothetical protein